MASSVTKEPLLPSATGLPQASLASLPSSIFNLANSIIGAGVLTLPYALRETGLLLGSMLLLVFALLSAISLSYLDVATRLTNTRTYGALGQYVYNSKRMFTLVNCVESLYSYGACVGYMSIIISELRVLTHLSNTGGNNILLLSCVLVLVFPLSLLRSMKALSFTR